jgi:hypothetical protein
MSQPTVHKLTTGLHYKLHNAHKLMWRHWAGDTQHTATGHRLLCGLSGFTSDTQPTVSLKDVSFSDRTPPPQSLKTHCVISGGRYNRSIEVRFPVQADLSPLQSVQSGCGVQAACYSLGSRALFLGAKYPGLESDNSPPSSAKFTKE